MLDNFFHSVLFLGCWWGYQLRVLELSISSVQSFSHVQLFFASPWTAAYQASLCITNSWSPPKPIPIESVMPSNHLILCHPLLLLPSIFPGIRVFSNESALCMKWPKYWSFSFSIIPSKEIPGLISVRMDWVGSPCSPRDSQESSPTPQFKSIHSSALSLLYGPTLTSIHDQWENHSSVFGPLLAKRCLCFLICCRGLS